MNKKIAQENEQFFKAIIENSLDGVRLIDEKGNILYASPSTTKILGYTPDEYKKANVLDLIHPNDREIYKNMMRDLHEHPRKVMSFMYRIKHKNGQMRWMEASGRNLFSNPDLNAIISTFRDVTQRVIAENNLSQTNQTLQAIIQSSPLAVYVVDTAGKVLLWSEAATNMFGWSEKDVLGKPLPFVQPEKRAEFRDLMQLLLSGKSFTRETVRRRKDGSTIDVSISASPIFDNQGQVTSIIAITSDISERKAFERQKDDFMGIVSHELKTPVTSLKAYAQVLETRFRKTGQEQAATLLTKMDGQIDKLTTLIRDLLDVTKIEGGKLQLRTTTFSLTELVDETIEELQRTTEKHRIVREGNAVCFVPGDRERIGQVLVNLLSNAIKYSPKSETITVKLTSAGKTAIVSVMDRGVGIPKADQPHIFDRFYRVSDASHNTVPGIGLGLYICAEIIKRHGGEIWVESTPKKGSMFSFSLPTAPKRKK